MTPPLQAADESNVGGWRVMQLHGSLGPHAQAWNALNQSLFQRHPLLSGNFVDGLLRHFGDGTEHLCVRESAGVVDAMCILRPRNRAMWTTFRPAQAQIGCLLFRGRETLNGLISALPGWVSALDILCVDPDYSGSMASAELSIRLQHALTMSVRMTVSYEGYLKLRSGNLRKNLRRYENRAQTDGLTARCEIASGKDEVASAVARYAAVEARGWKGVEGTALTPENDQQAFYCEVLTHEATEGRAEVHELWLGDQLAASRLIVSSSSSVVILKTTYDESLAKYAPGRLLLNRVLQHMYVNHPGKVVEFYTDATKDQLSWATHQRSIVNLRLYRNVAAGVVLHAARTVRHLHVRVAPACDPLSRVEVLTDLNDLPSDVVTLFDASCAQSGVQVTAGWYRLLANHALVEPSRTAVFVLRHGDVAVAALPLHAPVERPGVIASLSNFYSALYAPPIAQWLKATDLRPLVQAARTHWPGTSTWELAPLDPDGHAYLLLRGALEEEGLAAFGYVRFVNWWLERGGIPWRDYLATRDGAVRSTVSRMTRRLAAQGGRLEIITGGERLEAGIAAYQAVYAASWKKAEPFPRFVSELMRHCAAGGSLRLGIAWLGERPVAAQIWIVTHGRAEIFKLAYDNEYSALSAGTVLTAHLMAHTFDAEDIHEVDYLIGDDAYKRDWMSQRRQRWGVVALDPRTLRGTIRIARELAGRLLRRTPPRSAASSTVGQPIAGDEHRLRIAGKTGGEKLLV